MSNHASDELRAADPELARKNLASLGILCVQSYVGFGNQQALILVETTFNSGKATATSYSALASFRMGMSGVSGLFE
jgi:hypothetical protein